MTERFIPAAHYHFLTPVYEWIVRPFLRQTWDAMTEKTVRLASANARIIDIGCGPGTILRNIRQQRADLCLEGFDIDPRMLNIAKEKAHGMDITFAQTPIHHIPASDHSADIVICNMVFHHLSLETKRAAFTEVRRVLKPAGSFFLCDFSAREKDKPASSFCGFFLGMIEREVVPQLQGQPFVLAQETGATVRTLETFYGCVALLLIQFPAE